MTSQPAPSLPHLHRDPATGATPEEKETPAYWMRHSSQMAKKTADSQKYA